MPRYNPKDADMPLFAAGTYDALVKRAEEKTSQSGNQMIELILIVYGPNGTDTDVYDYLVFGGPSTLWKVRHFCESAGIDFDKGDLTAEECMEQNVRLKLKVDKQEGYKDKNAVVDYVERKGAAVPAAVAAKADDDIPF